MSTIFFFWSLITVHHVRTTQPFQNSPKGPRCIFFAWISFWPMHLLNCGIPNTVTKLVPLNWYENTMKERACWTATAQESWVVFTAIAQAGWHLTMGSSLSGTVHAHSTKVKSDETTAYIKTSGVSIIASSPNKLSAQVRKVNLSLVTPAK